MCFLSLAGYTSSSTLISTSEGGRSPFILSPFPCGTFCPTDDLPVLMSPSLRNDVRAHELIERSCDGSGIFHLSLSISPFIFSSSACVCVLAWDFYRPEIFTIALPVKASDPCLLCPGPPVSEGREEKAIETALSSRMSYRLSKVITCSNSFWWRFADVSIIPRLLDDSSILLLLTDLPKSAYLFCGGTV